MTSEIHEKIQFASLERSQAVSAEKLVHVEKTMDKLEKKVDGLEKSVNELKVSSSRTEAMVETIYAALQLEAKAGNGHINISNELSQRIGTNEESAHGAPKPENSVKRAFNNSTVAVIAAIGAAIAAWVSSFIR